MGLFAVGGGLSSIPFLMDLIEKYPDWYTQKE
ncbi:MAG: chromate transporter, partial [Clostridiales bacterium]|nr:chromate transporter [Clostridiales bacterium]